jgi:hypothetical protein
MEPCMEIARDSLGRFAGRCLVYPDNHEPEQIEADRNSKTKFVLLLIPRISLPLVSGRSCFVALKFLLLELVKQAF